MRTSLLSVLLSTALLAPAAFAGNDQDDRTEKSIKDSYTFRATLDNHVKVDVDNGVATLTGKVQDEGQSRLAEDTASEYPGVSHVVNKIKVSDEAKAGSDEWIAMKARSRLLVKANVSLTHTDIQVRNGMVILTGTADSQAQKELTEEYVKDLDGVKSVKNDIQVVERKAERDEDKADRAHDKAVRAEERAEDKAKHDGYTAGDRIDDSSITAQVKYELLAHRSTSALQTHVKTVDGRVMISGDASTDAEKDLVTKLAKSVRGVQAVDNNMTVRK